VRWAARHGLTLGPQRRQLYPDLTAADNIILGCYTWTRSNREGSRSDSYGRAIDLFPELKPHLKQAAGTLSRPAARWWRSPGAWPPTRRSSPSNEPCLGLAEALAKRVYDVLAQIHAAGPRLVVVEEAPRRALTLCNRRVEVRNGLTLHLRRDNPPIPPTVVTA